MRTFAQKPTATQQTRSTKSAISGGAHFAQSREVNSILHLLSRKSSCACGGGCPACQSHGNLKISQPSDPAEIEADQIADRVMRMAIVGAKPKVATSNKTNTIDRKCNACENEEDEVAERPVMRKKVFASATADTPSSIKSVISSGGRPLDLQTRRFFEPRLGYDLGSVRIHTETDAHESAKSIDAKAYTLGSHIVFGHGEYRPDSEDGKHLLAHELAHTTQSNHGANRVIHRRGGVAAPVLPNYWQRPGLRGSPQDQANLNRLGAGNAVVGISDASGRAIDPRVLCTDQGRHTNWGACVDLDVRQANFRMHANIEAREQPQIRLARGGSPSNYFIKVGLPTETYYSGSIITYTPRSFHIIDAMEHDFDLSTSYEADQILYMFYFPELQHAKITGKTDLQSLSHAVVLHVKFAPDPQSVPERLKALQGILDRRRTKILSRVRQQQEERIQAEAETATLTHKGKQKLQGACHSKIVPRKGGHPRHDKYAEHVAKEKGFGKVNHELEYVTPEDVSYSFDVYNPLRQSHVWEVKTMHDWAGPDKIAIAPRIVRGRKTKLPNLSQRIASLESQRLKGIYVAARCGLMFRYAFDNCEAYRGFREQWVLPPLEYVPYPGETKEVCND